MAKSDKEISNTGGIWLLLLLVILMPLQIAAQEKRSADDRFMEARELAFSGNRTASIDSCMSILVNHPDYYDVRIFMARVMAWEKNYSESIDNLQSVLEERKENREAIDALIDVYSWSGDYKLALKYSEDGLAYYSSDRDFLLKKAKALQHLERFDESAAVVNQLLELYPTDSEALELEDLLSESAIYNKLSINYDNDLFLKASPWHLIYLEYSRKVNFGTLILRINYGSRFGKNGVQAESDGYISIIHGMYVYLNSGYSGVSIFPKLRLGVEPYISLPYSFEMSLGMRYLEFSSAAVRIFTGSFGYYFSNYWLSYRFYITPKPGQTNFSSAVYLRRYLSGTENYITLRLGVGLVSYSELADEEFSGISSKGAAIDFQFNLYKLTYLRGEISYGNIEYYKGKYRDSYGLKIGIQQRF